MSEKGVGHKRETTSGRKWWEENETVLSEEGKTEGGLLGRGEARGAREEGLFFGCRIRPGLWTLQGRAHHQGALGNEHHHPVSG